MLNIDGRNKVASFWKVRSGCQPAGFTRDLEESRYLFQAFCTHFIANVGSCPVDERFSFLVLSVLFFVRLFFEFFNFCTINGQHMFPDVTIFGGQSGMTPKCNLECLPFAKSAGQCLSCANLALNCANLLPDPFARIFFGPRGIYQNCEQPRKLNGACTNLHLNQYSNFFEKNPKHKCNVQTKNSFFETTLFEIARIFCLFEKSSI